MSEKPTWRELRDLRRADRERFIAHAKQQNIWDRREFQSKLQALIDGIE